MNFQKPNIMLQIRSQIVEGQVMVSDYGHKH